MWHYRLFQTTIFTPSKHYDFDELFNDIPQIATSQMNIHFTNLVIEKGTKVALKCMTYSKYLRLLKVIRILEKSNFLLYHRELQRSCKVRKGNY